MVGWRAELVTGVKGEIMRATRTAIVTAGGTVLAVATAVLSGCSGGSSAAPATRATGSATAAPADTSAPMSGTGASASGPSGTSGSGSLDGATFAASTWAAMRKAGSAHVVLTTTSATGTTTAVGDLALAGGQVRQDLTIDINGAPTRVILVPGTLYMNVKDVALPAGKSWVKIAERGTDPLAKAMSPFFSMLTGNGLSSLNTSLTGVTVTKGDRQQAGGVAVTSYRYQAGPAQLAAMVASMPAELQAGVKKALADARITTELLVDDAGLLRKQQVITTIPGQQPSSSVSEYSKWGEPVTITEPAASKVVSSADLK